MPSWPQLAGATTVARTSGPGRSRQRAGQRAAGRRSSLRGLDELDMEPMGTDLPSPRISGRHRAVPRPLQPPCRARIRRPGNHRDRLERTRLKPSEPATARAPISRAPETSWVALPGLALVNLLEHENDS